MTNQVIAIRVSTTDNLTTVIGLGCVTPLPTETIIDIAEDYVSVNLPDASIISISIDTPNGTVHVVEFANDNEEKKEGINMTNTTINAEVINEDEATAFEAFKIMFENASEKFLTYGEKGMIRDVLTAQDCEVYGKVVKHLQTIQIRFFKKRDSEKLNEIHEVTSGLEEIEETVKEAGLLDKLKAIAAYVFRKAVALAKGVATFTLDTTVILGSLVGRVVYHVARESFFASKEIAKSFKNNVIVNVKNA